MPHGSSNYYTDKTITFIALKYHCKTLNEDFEAIPDNLQWHATNQDCEVCGSHGDITVMIRCKCGKTHDLQLDSW